MTKLPIYFPLLILFLIFMSACADREVNQSEKSHSSAQMEENVDLNTSFDISVTEVIDVEEKFITTYQTVALTGQSNQDMDLSKIKVRFEGWSPDGQYMLLAVTKGDLLEGKHAIEASGVLRSLVPIYDLWLAEIDGNPVRLLAQTVFWHTWSPDGTKIAYIHRTVKDNIFDNQLWIVNSDGNSLQKLTSNARSLAWLDNQTILFIDTNNEQFHLLDLSEKTTKPLFITGLPSQNSKVIWFALAPNYKKLAFDVRDDTKIRIALFTDNQATIVTEIESPDLSRLSWSPDSTYLAFAPLCSKPQHNPACQKIYIVEVDGTIVTEINHRPQTNVTWSPDSRLIAFQESNKVYMADTTTGELSVLHIFASGQQNTTDSIIWSPTTNQIGLNQTSQGGAIVLAIQASQ